MTNKELKQVIDYYNNVIKQGIIKPIEVNTIYKLIKGSDADTYISYHLKQRAISVYVQNLEKQVLDELDMFFKGIDKTDTASTLGSAADTSMTQSHNEDIIDDIVSDNDIEIAILEEEYSKANDANQKRSIRYKINQLKKK